MSTLTKTIIALFVLILITNGVTGAVNEYASEEQQMLDLINEERAQYDLEPLRFNAILNDAASEHSKEMIEKDYFSHNSYDGTSFSVRLENAGYAITYAGENIAMRYPPSVITAHEGLMNSPGHRANILSPNFNEIGIGIWVGEYSGYSNVAMYTQDFGWNPNVEIPLSISSFEPVSTTIISNGDVQLFRIQTNDICDISWSVDGTIVKSDEDVTQSSYNMLSLSEGNYDIEVIAMCPEGSDSVTWSLEVISPEVMKGDFDGDKDVDFDDFVEFAEAYDSTSNDLNYSSVFDFDNDDDVDFDDFVEFAALYNN